MSHGATHTVNLRLLSIPWCLGPVPLRLFPDVECFQVVYQTPILHPLPGFVLLLPLRGGRLASVLHVAFMNPEILGNEHMASH